MTEGKGKCTECGHKIDHLIRKEEVVYRDTWWIGTEDRREYTDEITAMASHIEYECPHCGSIVEDPHEVFKEDVSGNEPGEALPG